MRNTNRIRAPEADLLQFALAAMDANPTGNPNARRTDAPLRSAYSSDYLAERAAANAKSAAPKRAATKSLDGLFHSTLKDIYYAEKKILATLPKMAKAAQNPDLKAAFEMHRTQTEEQVARLEEVFEAIGKRAVGKASAAIMGIIDESAEIMEEYKGSPALDAGLLAAAQAVEHYEICRYGTMRAWAAELGMTEAVTLLELTLKEEKAADKILDSLAQDLYSFGLDVRKTVA